MIPIRTLARTLNEVLEMNDAKTTEGESPKITTVGILAQKEAVELHKGLEISVSEDGLMVHQSLAAFALDFANYSCTWSVEEKASEIKSGYRIMLDEDGKYTVVDFGNMLVRQHNAWLEALGTPWRLYHLEVLMNLPNICTTKAASMYADVYYVRSWLPSMRKRKYLSMNQYKEGKTCVSYDRCIEETMVSDEDYDRCIEETMVSDEDYVPFTIGRLKRCNVTPGLVVQAQRNEDGNTWTIVSYENERYIKETMVADEDYVRPSFTIGRLKRCNVTPGLVDMTNQFAHYIHVTMNTNKVPEVAYTDSLFHGASTSMLSALQLSGAQLHLVDNHLPDTITGSMIGRKCQWHCMTMFEWLRDTDRAPYTRYHFGLKYCCSLDGNGSCRPLADITMVFERKLMYRKHGIMWVMVPVGNSVENTRTRLVSHVIVQANACGYNMICLSHPTVVDGFLSCFFLSVDMSMSKHSGSARAICISPSCEPGDMVTAMGIQMSLFFSICVGATKNKNEQVAYTESPRSAVITSHMSLSGHRTEALHLVTMDAPDKVRDSRLMSKCTRHSGQDMLTWIRGNPSGKFHFGLRYTVGKEGNMDAELETLFSHGMLYHNGGVVWIMMQVTPGDFMVRRRVTQKVVTAGRHSMYNMKLIKCAPFAINTSWYFFFRSKE